MCVGCSKAFKSIDKVCESHGGGTHVGYRNFIHGHEPCDHVEVGFVVGDDEAGCEFFHHGCSGDQRIGAGTKANHHDFAAVAGVFNGLCDHAGYTHAFEHHIGRTTCFFFDAW